LDEQDRPADSSLEEHRNESTPIRLSNRFEHYELATDKEGAPIELGRGAMGITYKAFDVDLQCPATLKVINAKYLGDESSRLRFVREARAAASVRHPNVASVLHLGRTGSSYFYAMEFVEGETLENLIKRSGKLEVRAALEIATQVAAGLAAVHKQKLVHRNIKPSNSMVSLEDGCAVTVKIIDLGLAKAMNEPSAQRAISTPGGFAGTPEYASPEQFAGVAVDIRSDLYSLGVMLWEMVTGQLPFTGSSPELIYQHQHAALPLEQLRGAPQPVVVLLEALLEKDPSRRIRDPVELLQAISTITAAVEARRRIAHQNLQDKPPADRSGVTRKPFALQRRRRPRERSSPRRPWSLAVFLPRASTIFPHPRRGNLSLRMPLLLNFSEFEKCSRCSVGYRPTIEAVCIPIDKIVALITESLLL
jgi:serine/threonine protein kinase